MFLRSSLKLTGSGWRAAAGASTAHCRSCSTSTSPATWTSGNPAVLDGLAAEREVILFNNAGVASSSGEVPTIEHLFFVEEGIASMTTTFEDGAQVEVGMFGYESMIGVSALVGTRRSLNRVYTQIKGRGYSCELEIARK